ncbi:hypothetical protein BJ170DRAFT_206258 [Xylariales sp. AK1849]|nr:hypothetical protein BJ170DRAFT_206258 [Xylariales sp. AK1849]
MACPNCLWPLTNLSSEIAISSTTHNTATADCHITTTDWLEQLGEAIHAVWPERFVRYSKVAVLMLSWEDGDIRDTSSEFVRLRKVFKDEFHYEVEEWPIPPKKSVGRLSARVQQFVDTYDKPDNLLIVYYAGHARRCEPAGSFPVWRSKWKPDEGHEADTAAIYPLLTGTDDDAPDALMLSDCCHALCAHYPNRKPARAVVETLCAGGFDSEVPIPGPDSFTTALIDELSNAAKSPFPVSVPELHKEIVRRLEPFRERAVWNKDNTRRRSPNGDPTFTKDIRRTPVHLLLSVNRPTRTIFLETTRHKASTSQNGSHNNASWRDKTEDSPSVLLVVRVLEDEKAVSEQVARWVKDAPAVVVDFKGFYRSFSTLILVQVPFAVWDMLPPCAAVSFAGFLDEPWQTVRSQELCGTDYRPTGYQARGPFDGSAALSVDEANKPERSIVHSAPSSSDNAQTTSTSIQATNRSSEEQLFMPRTTNQKTLMALLDSADKILPSIFATWKTKQVARNIEGLLFEEFRQRLNNSGMNSNIPDEAITLHQVCQHYLY